jgi:hypothetical protein
VCRMHTELTQFLRKPIKQRTNDLTQHCPKDL